MAGLTGQAAIVTGGAQGIGRAVVGYLAEAGANVLIADLQEEKAGQVCADVRTKSRTQIAATRTDITSATDCEAMAGACLQRFGRIDILVNVAGGAVFIGMERRPVDETPEPEFRRIIELNLHGAFLAARAVVPEMKRRRYGRIVLVSSVAGRTRSRSGIHAYAAGKAGVLGLMRDMAYELGDFGITVNSVAPGFIESNPRARAVWEEMDPTKRLAYESELAVKRLGRPEEIAEAVMYFASPGAAYTTGQTLIVDGGRVTY